MGKGSYLGGNTVIRGGKGFTALPEGGEGSGKPSTPTQNQLKAMKRSNKIKNRRTAKVRKGLKAKWSD